MILQILIITGIIVFTVVKKLLGSREEGKKQQRRTPVVLPDGHKNREEVKIIKPASSLQTNERQPIPPPVQEEPDDNHPEFDIHSAEEVRRGILWSEILNRKY